jgi:hypothetical protein
MKKHICVLIISYDKYLHLAEINFLSIKKYWKDIDYDMYYLSNHSEFSNNYNEISNIKVGHDYSWSMSLKKALKELSENYTYVLTLIDDLILKDYVKNDELKEVINNFIKNKGNHLKLINKPKPNLPFNNYFGELSPRMPYRSTTVFTVWRIDLLIGALRDEENAWDFEIKSKLRVMDEIGFYSVHKSMFSFKNTVVKGKYQWGFNKIIKDLDAKKIIIPPYKYFNLKDYGKRAFLKIRHNIYMFLISIIKK